MARRELRNAREDAGRIRHVAQREILMDRHGIDLRRKVLERQKAAELGAEEHAAVRFPIVQRLDAHPVPREREARCRVVPDREGEHPSQLVHQLRRSLFVEMHENFRVAARSYLVARGEARPQCPEVVDFTVEDDMHGAVFV